MIGDLRHKRVKPCNTCHQILADVKVNPSPPTHLRNLYKKNGLKFLFSQNLLRHHKEVENKN